MPFAKIDGTPVPIRAQDIMGCLRSAMKIEAGPDMASTSSGRREDMSIAVSYSGQPDRALISSQTAAEQWRVVSNLHYQRYPENLLHIRMHI